MADGGHPCVYVVDSHANRPPLPPRLTRRPQRAGLAQTLLFLLVAMALCGMAVEACFIYRLYRTESDTSASTSQQIGGAALTSPRDIRPSKPVAHLTDGNDAIYRTAPDQIMTWSVIAEPLLYEMDYKEGQLIIQKEGFYYVYSKVFFWDDQLFSHSISLKTELYSGKSITLLQSRKFSDGSRIRRSNNFLGGVFHLRKGDAIFVQVNNVSKIIRHKSYENTFGAFMI